MVSPPRAAAGVAAALGLLAVGVAFAPRTAATSPPAPAVGPPQVIGMAGCAATGCHGRPDVTAGPPTADVWHESFSRWIDRDPHTRAYAVLESPLGKQIMQNLAGKGNAPTPAGRDARCVACHATPSLAVPEAMADARLDRLRAEGVSCEACHGNAERWQIAHTNWTNPATRAADFAAAGMIDLNDWSTQAKTCAGCHVGAKAGGGAPVRDMNHDMIAAGHPRLEFEFAAFHQKLSKHWLPKHRGPGLDPGRDALLHGYVLGQIAVDQAYCDLSLDRLAAKDAGDPRRPYPEFADWNCSQCHHNLVPQPFRAAAAAARAKASREHLGRPVWIGASAVLPAMPTPLFKQSRNKQAEELAARKDRLSALTDAVRGKSSEEVRKQMRLFLITPLPDAPLNWEEATRQYLALRSLAAVAGGPPAGGDPFAPLHLALWGKDGPPSRREFTKKADPGYGGYQRKPESRWPWETPGGGWKPVNEVVTALRADLAARLQNLPP